MSPLPYGERCGSAQESVASTVYWLNHNLFPHEPDHSHRKKTWRKDCPPNLALACFDCNRFKGSDIASIDLVTGTIVPLFNPRTQRWSEHFRLYGDGRIAPITATGRVTETLLRLNLPERMVVRARLMATGSY